jgi:hypothetical protein
MRCLEIQLNIRSWNKEIPGFCRGCNHLDSGFRQVLYKNRTVIAAGKPFSRYLN